MTTENSEGRKDASTSNVSHVSGKPLQCIHIITPYVGHVVRVTFRSHCNAYDMFSNTARLSSNLFNSGKNNVLTHERKVQKHEAKLSVSNIFFGVPF